MQYVAIIIISIITLIILKFAWNIKIKDIKKIKELGYNKDLNQITNKLPENKEICKNILKKLNNEKVKIEKDNNNKTSLYLVLSDSILIANIKDTFTRVQTIAHECLHSIQNRKILIFNFVFSNIYFIYFIVVCILGILKISKNFEILSLFILIMASFVHYTIRSYLEMDAMTKAKPLAKEYMEEEGSLNKEEQKEILENYEIINDIGIKLTNYILIAKCIFKLIMYLLILIIF
ncbi:MAG: hypothetical protein ACI4UU_01920 [Clostridia bacterium]